jgi:hypothetical protein
VDGWDARDGYVQSSALGGRGGMREGREPGMRHPGRVTHEANLKSSTKRLTFCEMALAMALWMRGRSRAKGGCLSSAPFLRRPRA